MQFNRKAVLAGIASLALAGGAATAAPGDEAVKVMNLSLPDGSVARIHYQGDTPPRVVIAEAPAPRWFMPVAAYRFEAAPFATFHQIAAEMNQRMAEMMRLMELATPVALDGAPGLRLASNGTLPEGGYSFVSRSVTQGGCTRTVHMTRTEADAEPNVVTRTSGDCDGGREKTPAEPAESRVTI
jgi:hypothetical protein